MVRTASIISSEPLPLLQADSRSSLAALKSSGKRGRGGRKILQGSTPDLIDNSDSSRSDGVISGNSRQVYSFRTQFFLFTILNQDNVII